MWKKYKFLFANLCLLLIFFFMVNYIFKYFFTNVDKNNYDYSSLEFTEEKIQPLSEDEIKNKEFFMRANNIIDFIENNKTEKGFYGLYYNCSMYDEIKCINELEQINKNVYGADLVMDQSSLLAITWANFKYYINTGDKKKLEIMKTNLETIDNNFNLPNKKIKISRLGCLLMEEIVFSEHISHSDKIFAAKACNQIKFDHHPSSRILYSQNYLSPLKFANNDYDWYEIPTEFDNQKIINQSERINYQPERIISEISQDIRNFYLTGKVEKESNIHQDEKERFIYREIMAAIDRIGAIKINEKINPEKAKADLIDYLLLTQETLEWYINQPERINSFYVSLIGKNLKYLILNYQTDLTEEEKQFVFDWAEREMVKQKLYTELIDFLLFNKEVDNKLISEILATNKQYYQWSNWNKGLLYKYFEWDIALFNQNFAQAEEYDFFTYYDLTKNILLAGLLLELENL